MKKKIEKAQKICALIQLRAYKRRLSTLEKSRWDKMIKIILEERQKQR